MKQLLRYKNLIFVSAYTLLELIIVRKGISSPLIHCQKGPYDNKNDVKIHGFKQSLPLNPSKFNSYKWIS